MELSTIKGYDRYGYELVNFSIPTIDNFTTEMNEFASAIRTMGLSAQEATEAISRISEILARLNCIECVVNDEITTIKNRLDENERIINNLRPDLDVQTENPNQKTDLEIFDQIVWDKDFLDLCENNPFLIDLN